ncbi:unnamed protein product [Thlaspi arvense]|uniref:F-box domain-containing protein n=1 Tax=Thlaspi arvense TaxID=13288 RepID=A0AAU9T1N8_THLAR|nr:unnamed protein product [Thlaspi arvense]
METTLHLPEVLLTEIQARLPFRSISKFKCVCKTWKTTLESLYFRRLYLSLRQNRGSSWSLLCGVKELIGETWDLPKSLASYIPPPFLGISASSNGLVLVERYSDCASCFVGNPVLQQWVEIPPPPHRSDVFGLVTRVDPECGAVLGFKVVRLAAVVPIKASPGALMSSTYLSLCVYSSDTGVWTSEGLYCPRYISNRAAMTLNGMIYLSQTQPGVLISHDFYAESDQCSLTPLPDPFHSNLNERAALTTSRGFVMYIKTLGQNRLKVWRLVKDSGDACWQLLWDVCLPFTLGSHAPMAVHPFDADIVYIWSQHSHRLVSCNLRTQNYGILGAGDDDDAHQNFFMNHSVCDENIDEIWSFRSSDWDFGPSIDLSQFVPPLWMDSVPRPPQVEMMDTTSLLSYIKRTQNEAG